eukprot:CAMPEP_0118849492 /NCGR_PEP_ID=MMETSP1162-20130426/93993_1 /TAXON_ID=33656 /ORGANISM="Phaeocystis Sp, Strain CCMP2710" /LENGTH=253 /DNA_ID=CAMNT_0006781683 /DNA_START=227 /DNA_END=985 /DNA_ORIENTATION=+
MPTAQRPSRVPGPRTSTIMPFISGLLAVAAGAALEPAALGARRAAAVARRTAHGGQARELLPHALHAASLRGPPPDLGAEEDGPLRHVLCHRSRVRGVRDGSCHMVLRERAHGPPCSGVVFHARKVFRRGGQRLVEDGPAWLQLQLPRRLVGQQDLPITIGCGGALALIYRSSVGASCTLPVSVVDLQHVALREARLLPVEQVRALVLAHLPQRRQVCIGRDEVVLTQHGSVAGPAVVLQRPLTAASIVRLQV